MSYGTITVGRLTLRETFSLASGTEGATGERRLRVEGQESNPPLTMAELRQRQEDILGLRGAFLPIRFTNKTDQDGWYLVTDANTELTNFTGEVARVDWQLAATRIGAANEVDVESRVVNIVRSNVYGQAGVRWHSPAYTATAYYTGSTSGSLLNRTGAHGVQPVYLGIPAGVNPTWSVSLANYTAGGSVLLVDSTARTGTSVTIPSASTGWEVNNGLTKVVAGTAVTMTVSCWGDTAAYESAKGFDIFAGGVKLTGNTCKAISVLRNDPEMVTVRMLWDGAPGRHLLDVSLRRGSRFAECYLQTHASAVLIAQRTAAEAGTAPASAGYISATANDAGGNRYIVGSAGTFTALTTQGGISASATTTLDFYVGFVVGGSAAVSGDQAANLQDQYIAVTSEETMGVRR